MTNEEPVEVTIHNVTVVHCVTYTAEQMTILLPAAAVTDGEADHSAVQSYFEGLPSLDDCADLAAQDETVDVESFDDD